MGAQKCRIVGKYQSVRIMISPIIFTRTRTCRPSTVLPTAGVPRWLPRLAGGQSSGGGGSMA
jgi:hypothetical protein